MGFLLSKYKINMDLIKFIKRIFSRKVTYKDVCYDLFVGRIKSQDAREELKYLNN